MVRLLSCVSSLVRFEKLLVLEFHLADAALVFMVLVCVLTEFVVFQLAHLLEACAT